ncbi:unnamed protein product [Withania somnifera]
MARNYAFYFIIALLVMSGVNILAARDLAELESKLTGQSLQSGCGGYCRTSSDYYDRYCKYCYYNVIRHTYGCG